MTDLTRQQREALDIVRAHHRRTGAVPSPHVLADHMARGSFEAAVHHLAALEQLGYLARVGLVYVLVEPAKEGV